MNNMRKTLLPACVFVAGGFVGPMLYWVMPLLPRYDMLYYGVGPLIWPTQLSGPVMDLFGSSNMFVLVGLNVLLYGAVGLGVAAIVRNTRLLLSLAAVIGVGVIISALSAVGFRIRDLIGEDGTMLIAVLIALAYYAALIFLEKSIAMRLQGR
jgi:hypothetical protein